MYTNHKHQIINSTHWEHHQTQNLSKTSNWSALYPYFIKKTSDCSAIYLYYLNNLREEGLEFPWNSGSTRKCQFCTTHEVHIYAIIVLLKDVILTDTRRWQSCIMLKDEKLTLLIKTMGIYADKYQPCNI